MCPRGVAVQESACEARCSRVARGGAKWEAIAPHVCAELGQKRWTEWTETRMELRGQVDAGMDGTMAWRKVENHIT